MVDEPLSAPPTGSSLADLISTQKGGVQNLSQLLQSVQNALPPATTTTSPRSTGFNSLNTVGTSLIATSAMRRGIVFHNPGTTSVFVYPSLTSPVPTTTAAGGAFIIFAGDTLSFPSTMFPNVNCGWSGFSQTGSSQALTVVEFY